MTVQITDVISTRTISSFHTVVFVDKFVVISTDPRSRQLTKFTVNRSFGAGGLAAGIPPGVLIHVYQTARCQIPDDRDLYSYNCEIITSFKEEKLHSLGQHDPESYQKKKKKIQILRCWVEKYVESYLPL
jgi:hypothetical protein